MKHLKPYPAYKESGIPWLGKVPEHWEVRTVRHVTRPLKGRQPEILYSEDDAPAEAIPYITMEYLRKVDGKAKFFCIPNYGLITAKSGDIILLWDGANAGEFFIAKEGVISSTSALLSTNKYNKLYLYFILKQCEPWLRAFSTGMGIPHVDGGIFKQMQISLPPLPEQTAIVRFLDYIDRRIRRVINARQRQIKLLEEYKQAIIHQAVTGQIDVRTGKPYPAYKDSGIEWLGKVPEHWEVRKLQTQFRRHGSGTTPSGDEFFGGTIPWVMTGDLNDGLITETKRTVTSGAIEKFSALKIFPAGSLIVAMYGATIGKTGVLAMEACTNQACCVLAEPKSSCSVKFLQMIINIARPYLIEQSYGGGQPNINSEIVRYMKSPLPPLTEQIFIVKYLDVLSAKIETSLTIARREIELLREYRERLIADVVTGKLDVREIAEQLPEESEQELEEIEIEEESETNDEEKIEATNEDEELEI
jgi:type I restriction enzyme S subunit